MSNAAGMRDGHSYRNAFTGSATATRHAWNDTVSTVINTVTSNDATNSIGEMIV
jgi:hypothetical protein